MHIEMDRETPYSGPPLISYSAPNKRSATTYPRLGGKTVPKEPWKETPGQFAGRLQGIVVRLGASRMHFQNPPVLESASKIEYIADTKL